MFDLFRSREKSVRYILIALLSLVALSLVITLIPGIGGGYARTSDINLIAEIGGEPVTAQELRQLVQQQMQSGGLQRQMASVYVPLMAQELIATRAVAYQAERMGFQVNDAEAAEIIRSLLPSLFEGGKFAGRDMYAAILAQQNLTIPSFEANIKRQTLATRLEVLALEGSIVTPQEVENAYRLKNDRIVISYALLTADKFKGSVTVTPEEVRKVYDANPAVYNTPEKRTFVAYPVEESKVAAGLVIPEPELKAAYQAQIESFRTPERVRVRHILLKTEGKSEAETAELRKRAEDLRQKIKGGANMAELATKFSDDTGSAQNGGDLDWVTRGQTVPEFEQAAFSLKPGEVSDVVKTVYGFHVLRVESKEEARLKPFEEAKEELKKNLSRQRVYDRMQTIAEQIRAALLQSVADADKVAAANGVTPIRATNVTRNDLVPGIGANPVLGESVWGLQKGGVTPLLTLDPSRVAVARVEEITPPRPAEFAEVQEQIRQNLLLSKQSTVLSDKVREFGEKLQAAGGDLSSVARQYGVEVATSKAFSRNDPAVGAELGIRFEQGFRKNVGETFGPITTGNGSYFCKVVEKQPADLTGLAAERDDIVRTLKAQRGRQRRDLLYDGVVNQLVKQKKIKIYEDNIRRLAATYGG